jgi:hypothetical protein
MALIHSNLLIEDSIKAIKERLKTTLGNIKFQDGQVFWDDIEKLEHCIMVLENLENKEDEEDESIYELTDGEAQEYAYYTAYWEE